ncbi:MAG: MFS transporter [Sedimenticola sp.]|mgnify:CR=1 FL=1|jgi:MFS family permease|nr:MAG: MFS transporter [Sedimenticola sp.]
MSATESRAAISLAGIFSLRMLGLFLILPVFALYAENLDGVTPQLIGVAIGAYGLTQALLQIPFGMLSDRIGRKPVIIGGLLIFALGSVIAAMSDSIWGVILGRAIQGSGAIAAAVMALAADLTREQYRLRIMAVIGISIGVAFAIALVLGPILNSLIGVKGIFWLTAVLAISGIYITIVLVPNPERSTFHRDAEPVPALFGRVLTNANLLRLDAGILILHMILTSVFIVVPFALRDAIGLTSDHHWMVYLPVLLLAMVMMIPFVVIAEKRRQMKPVFLAGVAALMLSLLGFSQFYQSLVGLSLMLFLFFTAFNLLEATLPSLIAKVAPADSKGTAMGVYSTSQFMGAFLGGVVGGWIYTHHDMPGVFLFAALAALVWLIIASGMAQPSYVSSHVLRVGAMDEAQASELRAALLDIAGVADAAVDEVEGMAYLKIDPQVIDLTKLDQFAEVS